MRSAPDTRSMTERLKKFLCNPGELGEFLLFCIDHPELSLENLYLLYMQEGSGCGHFYGPISMEEDKPPAKEQVVLLDVGTYRGYLAVRCGLFCPVPEEMLPPGKDPDIRTMLKGLGFELQEMSGIRNLEEEPGIVYIPKGWSPKRVKEELCRFYSKSFLSNQGEDIVRIIAPADPSLGESKGMPQLSEFLTPLTWMLGSWLGESSALPMYFLKSISAGGVLNETALLGLLTLHREMTEDHESGVLSLWESSLVRAGGGRISELPDPASAEVKKLLYPVRDLLLLHIKQSCLDEQRYLQKRPLWPNPDEDE